MLKFVLDLTDGGSCHKYHFCRDKSFVATSIVLSRQTTCFVATNTCLSLATKIILVAARANDRHRRPNTEWQSSQTQTDKHRMAEVAAQIEPKSFESRRKLPHPPTHPLFFFFFFLLFFISKADTPRVYMRAWMLCCFHSLICTESVWGNKSTNKGVNQRSKYVTHSFGGR